MVKSEEFLSDKSLSRLKQIIIKKWFFFILVGKILTEILQVKDTGKFPHWGKLFPTQGKNISLTGEKYFLPKP